MIHLVKHCPETSTLPLKSFEWLSRRGLKTNKENITKMGKYMVRKREDPMGWKGTLGFFWVGSAAIITLSSCTYFIFWLAINEVRILLSD